VRASTDSGDEIAVLARGFNEMAGNMQTLVNKVKADQQRMRQTDLRLLQAQINPHFLYNTLDTIIWLIEGNKADEAVEMVVTLSEFFRLALSKGKELISLGEERQHISSYLEIQEVRYRDILEYDIQIAPSLYGYQILKLTLQPLVENALYHGIKYKRAKGYIHIKAEKDGDVLRLSVRDNGAGMEEEELRQLQREIKKPCQETEKGFGLANVNERIQMYFGPEYGMRIESQKDNGTYVEITIPAIERGVTEYGIAVGTDEKAKG
jgi:sensor histidine kinase YesM